MWDRQYDMSFLDNLWTIWLFRMFGPVENNAFGN